MGTARDFLTRLWNLDNGDRPGFLVGYVGPKVKGGEPVRSALFSTEGKFTVRERLLDPSRFLAAQLEEIESQARLRGDLVPALCPTLGVIAIPSAFGAEFVPSGFQPWLPDGTGLSVANDVGLMLSPRLHDEFSVPYLNRISEAFGGI